MFGLLLRATFGRVGHPKDFEREREENMKAGAIIVQAILSVPNIGLLLIGIVFRNEMELGAHVALWGALAGFIVVQALFLKADWGRR